MSDNIEVIRMANIQPCYTCNEPAAVEIYLDCANHIISDKVVWLCKNCVRDLVDKLAAVRCD